MQHHFINCPDIIDRKTQTWAFHCFILEVTLFISKDRVPVLSNSKGAGMVVKKEFLGPGLHLRLSVLVVGGHLSSGL